MFAAAAAAPQQYACMHTAARTLLSSILEGVSREYARQRTQYILLASKAIKLPLLHRNTRKAAWDQVGSRKLGQALPS